LRNLAIVDSGRLTVQTEVATNLQISQTSRTSGSLPPLPHTPSCRSAYLVKRWYSFTFNLFMLLGTEDRLSGLVVRVPGQRSVSPGSIPDATRFSEK
jgi:hypothetical protein